MPMRTFKLTLRPESAFGTPLAGDTLFGHLCWALRWRQGEASLTALLEGYTRGQPFAVLSDALPAGLLPRPNLPASRLQRAGDPKVDPQQRKAERSQLVSVAGRSRLHGLDGGLGCGSGWTSPGRCRPRSAPRTPSTA
ncbi:MAG: hypothetical protein IPG57_10385 [Burkholderiales bacterium]|nr:hypothetical protein [Burkholderiales bacterium]